MSCFRSNAQACDWSRTWKRAMPSHAAWMTATSLCARGAGRPPSLGSLRSELGTSIHKHPQRAHSPTTVTNNRHQTKLSAFVSHSELYLLKQAGPGSAPYLYPVEDGSNKAGHLLPRTTGWLRRIRTRDMSFTQSFVASLQSIRCPTQEKKLL